MASLRFEPRLAVVLLLGILAMGLICGDNDDDEWGLNISPEFSDIAASPGQEVMLNVSGHLVTNIPILIGTWDRPVTASDSDFEWTLEDTADSIEIIGPVTVSAEAYLLAMSGIASDDDVEYAEDQLAEDPSAELVVFKFSPLPDFAGVDRFTITVQSGDHLPGFRTDSQFLIIKWE